MDQSTQVVIENPWAKSAEQVMESLGVDPAGGLSREEVAQRRKKYGHNRLREIGRAKA